MSETTRAPVDVFAKATTHDRMEQLEAAREADLLPYFRLIESEAGPLMEVEGREVVMLGSNNYLGLTGDERVRQGARDALERYGTGLTGSRFLNGTTPLHVQLERELADWMGTEETLVFTTGHQANAGSIGTILGPSDTVICDSADHASIMDGVRLSGAKLRPFRHNQMPKLERMLERAASDGGGVLVIVDGVFSMEGDLADLPTIADLCERYGARLMVDEAHGVGVLGARGAGASELFGVEDRVDLRMGTFSKSLASCGGFIAGSSEVIDFVRFSSRPFIFTASAVPAAVGAALAALQVIREEGPALMARLLENADYLRRGFPRSRPAGHRAGQVARWLGGLITRRTGCGRRGLAGGASVEGAVRRRRLHQRGDPPRRTTGRSVASDVPDGDTRARTPRPRSRDYREDSRALPRGAASVELRRLPRVASRQTTDSENSPARGRNLLSNCEQGVTGDEKPARSERRDHLRGVVR